MNEQLVKKVFTATFEESEMTKTVLDDIVGENGYRGLLWEPDDEIGVASYNGWYQHFVNIVPEPTANGIFEGNAFQSAKYYAIYPYQSDMRHGTSVSVTIPTIQIYKVNSFARNMAPMVGMCNDGETLHFMNPCGVLAVQLTGTEVISSITFETKNGELVSGPCLVDTDYVEYPVLDTSTATASYVTLDCGEGVQLSGEAVPFHIVLPPGVYEGFTLYITTTDGKFMQKTTGKTLTITNSIITKAAAFAFEENLTDVTDLSERGNSNCYIVSEAGLYSFDATTIGNGEFGIIESAGFHTNVPSISPESVELLWEDREGLIKAFTLDETSSKIKFLASDKKGNALLAAKNAEGTVLWSWHIWMTDSPTEQIYIKSDERRYTMFDRNLGATRADRGSDEQWKDAVGILYQWGRKDPIAYDHNQNPLFTRAGYSRQDMISAISNPTYVTTYYDWSDNMNSSWWKSDQKTIYDPCPVGYRVPPAAVWDEFADHRVKYDKGWDFNYDGTNTTYYPSTSVLENYGTGYSLFRENTGDYWDADYKDRLYFYYYSDTENDMYTGTASSSYGFSVRCMKDEQHVDISTYLKMKNVKASDVTTSSATVSGGFKYGQGTTISERGFIFGTTSDFSGGDTKYITVDSDVSDFSYTFTELNAETKYYVKAYVINENGTYESNVVSIFTNSTDGYINLSADGTANSYIISDIGSYMFDAGVKGNSDEEINGISASLIWEVDAYRDSRESNIHDIRLENGLVKFYLADNAPGNALIAVHDDYGVIIWSWHIWIVDYDPETEFHTYLPSAEAEPVIMMDRVLGASQSEPDYNNLGNTWELTAGMLYQWGRKDPLIYDLLNDTSIYRYNSVEDAIARPLTSAHYDYWWIEPFDYTLWSSTAKTKYDPCPAGWRMPGPEVFSAMNHTQTHNPYGVVYDINDQSVWFGYGDYLHCQPVHYINNSESYIWTTGTRDNNHGIAIRYYGGYNQNDNYYTDAYPVRCMKEQ